MLTFDLFRTTWVCKATQSVWLTRRGVQELKFSEIRHPWQNLSWKSATEWQTWWARTVVSWNWFRIILNFWAPKSWPITRKKCETRDLTVTFHWLLTEKNWHGKFSFFLIKYMARFIMKPVNHASQLTSDFSCFVYNSLLRRKAENRVVSAERKVAATAQPRGVARLASFLRNSPSV